jgi:hypothetical protein
MNPAAKSLAISSSIALRFFLLKQHRCCLTGLEPCLIFKACSCNFSWYAHHIRGLPRKDIFIGAEEVDERAFLFRGECGADLHLLVLRVVGVDEDLFDALRGFKGSGGSLEVNRFLRGFLPDDCKFLGGDDHRSELTAFHLTLVGTLERGTDGDNPT